MATRVVEFPINGGQNEGADRTLLEPGELRNLYNGRLTRDGRIEVRPGYVSISMNDPNVGTLVAQDLTTYRGHLVALTKQGSINGPPAHLSTYVTPDAGVWETVSAGPMPAWGEITNVWQNPSGAAARQFDLAYANGQLCAVQVDDSNVLTVVRLLTDGTQLMRTQISPISSARVVACGNTFVLVTRGTTGTMAARTFDTTTTTDTFSGATTLEATVATGTAHWDLANIPGTTDYLVSYPRPASNNTRLRRYTVAHSLSATLDFTRVTSVGDSAVAANSTPVIVWLCQDGNDITEHRLDGSLSITAGPTTRATIAGVRAPSVGFVPSASTKYFAAWTTATASSISGLALSGGGGSSDASAPNVVGSSKVIPINNGITGGACYMIGSISAGDAAGSLSFRTSALYDGSFPGNVHGTWDYGIAAPLDILSASDTGGRSSVVSDGTYYYALTGRQRGLEVGTTSPGGLRLVKFRQTDRHQTVEAAGSLYIAGGAPAVWDGQVLSSASFPDVPRITATAEDGSGSQTALATYNYVVMYEYTDGNGNIARSTPSEPTAVTLTGANNRAIITATTPRTAKSGLGITSRVVLYRANPNDSVFFRVAESGDLSGVDVQATTTINDGASDTAAETREVLYTQSQKPTANVAPLPCQFLAVGKDRVICGGLPDPNAVQISQLLFPGEPVEWASPNSLAHTVRLPEPVTGVACPGDALVVFTDSAIYEISGEGPQRNGQGEFFAPRAIASDGGCIDWRSIVETDRGTFFQLDDDKLCILGRDGQVQWIGQPVRDTLESYPVITGACLCSTTQRVVFSAQNTAGNDGVLLIYDLRRGIWSVDDVGAVDAVTEYLGRLAYASSLGTIFLENAAIGAGGTMPTLSLRYGDFRLFSALGNGDVCKIGLLVTYLGDSTVEGFISYDDGKTWTSMGSVAVTTANTDLGNPVSGSALASGDPVPLIWTPKKRNVDRFALRFDVTNATDSGACRLHTLSLELQADEFTSRKGAGSQR